MGTPEFAVPSLKALIENKFDIKLVVTQPDRPSGRGQKLSPPPVKVCAEQFNIPVLQPHSLRSDKEAVEKIKSIPCDFLVVVAFGQILPKVILDHPKVAPLNVHASLLPAYRGAAPIARSILEGEEKTGITIQWMIEALDQGDILYQVPCQILETDTAGSLHDRLMHIGADALIECLHLFEKNQIVRRSQDARVGTYAAKLQKAEAIISFNQPAIFVHKAIMGMNPWPIARCQIMGKVLQIYRSHFVGRHTDASPGTVIDTSDGEIVVACEQGCVAFTEVQLENRKRLSTEEFLKGHPIPNGLILGTHS
ncbi:MAG: Methionyl-tRNA formyltransferase [Bacteriovoracaceae bacterium]|nr:Methionyl-tRNA formyltransferase [Bacteriovoracaceae bacterium]